MRPASKWIGSRGAKRYDRHTLQETALYLSGLLRTWSYG
jgi:hypothetical protein